MSLSRSNETVLLALGANIAGAWGAPWRGMGRALAGLAAHPRIRIGGVSDIWRCAAFGRLRQPPFFNAVAVLETGLSPQELLATLQALERRAGRRRGRPWAARALDLDLLAHGGRIIRPAGMGRRGSAAARHRWQKRGLILPHPGLSDRAFVLAPLCQVRRCWRHPLEGADAGQLLARLPWRQRASCRKIRHGEVAAYWRRLRERLLAGGADGG